jgi:hypothetical protein
LKLVVLRVAWWIFEDAPPVTVVKLGRWGAKLQGLQGLQGLLVTPIGQRGANWRSRLLMQTRLGSGAPLGAGLPRGPWDTSPRSPRLAPVKFSSALSLPGVPGQAAAVAQRRWRSGGGCCQGCGGRLGPPFFKFRAMIAAASPYILLRPYTPLTQKCMYTTRSFYLVTMASRIGGGGGGSGCNGCCG